MLEGFCTPTLQPFIDTSAKYDEARYVLIGVPMDQTASYRSGSRFAPDAIRQASLYMETYSIRTRLDWEDVVVADAGNMKFLQGVGNALGNIEAVVSLVNQKGKAIVMLGGEHTITLGALRAIKPQLVVDFDAHLDLRNRLLGKELSHATFMRRSMDELDHSLIILGCRAISSEERKFVEANKDRITVITADNLMRGGIDQALETVKMQQSETSSAYLTIDMDVIDPASAPAVGNPSPEGISVTTLLDIISGIVDKRFTGFDLTEVTPHYDSGLTAAQASYITLEVIYSMESARRRHLN